MTNKLKTGIRATLVKFCRKAFSDAAKLAKAVIDFGRRKCQEMALNRYAALDFSNRVANARKTQNVTFDKKMEAIAEFLSAVTAPIFKPQPALELAPAAPARRVIHRPAPGMRGPGG